MPAAWQAGNLPQMKILTVDDYQRVRLPNAKPRAKLRYEKGANGVILLTELVPAETRPARVRLRKRGRFTVATTDQPVSEEAIKQALADFP